MDQTGCREKPCQLSLLEVEDLAINPWGDDVILRLSKLMRRSQSTFGYAANSHGLEPRNSDLWNPMACFAMFNGRRFQENPWQICCDRHRCFDQKVDYWIVPSGGAGQPCHLGSHFQDKRNWSSGVFTTSFNQPVLASISSIWLISDLYIEFLKALIGFD